MRRFFVYASPPGLEPGTALLERAILPLDDGPKALLYHTNAGEEISCDG